MIDMKEPKVIEKFADNGEHSHWELIAPDTGILLWSEDSNVDEIICAEDIVNSAIIGSVEIIGCSINHPSKWAEKTDASKGYYENPIKIRYE